MHVLVIDDDPKICEEIRQLIPAAQVCWADDGLTGLELARSLRDQLAVIVLDVRMKYDGVDVALRLRYELPELRILPYSYATDTAELFAQIGGLAPLLPKPAPPELLRKQIMATAAMPAPPPLERNVWTDQIWKRALDRAQHQERSCAVMLLSSSDLLPLFEPALNASGQAGRIVFNQTQLESVLRRASPQVLIADSDIQHQARRLALQYGLALLVVVLTLDAGYRLMPDGVSLLFRLRDAAKLNQALQALRTGQRYLDPAFAERLCLMRLTDTEQAMIPFLLRGDAPRAIGYALGIEEASARRSRRQLFDKLGCESIGDLITCLNRSNE